MERQKTRPMVGEPVEIPVPTKADVMKNLAKTAKPVDSKRLRPRRPKKKAQ